MGNSLFEQLTKSGLVDEKKAKKAKHDQYKHKKQKSKKRAASQEAESALLAQMAHTEKVERDRQLNQLKKEKTDRTAIAAQIKQLIETNRIEDSGGDLVYNFTDANVVKRIYISAQVYEHLMTGRLAIAKLGEGYELVPTPVADKIKQRDECCVIKCEHSIEAELVEGDPYADYIIPDDLRW